MARTGGRTQRARRIKAVETAEPGPSHRAVFSTVAPADVVTAIVRRIRAAIGLGLLDDGDRLPRESDLAEQLGVTTFALREGLSRLREEGLIVTRPGKGGGSFVRSGPATELAGGELERLSNTELRDLSDWRRTLVSASAYLAALRSPASTPQRLGQLATVVGHGKNDGAVRRAYGRFHTELAAAAQSARMTRAEFALHEDFDWLLTVALSDQDYRARVSEELLAIADAIGRRDPARARQAAEDHVTATTHALIRLRLARLATVAGTGVRIQRPGAQSLLDELRRITSIALERLEGIAQVAQAAHREGVSAEEFRRRLSATTMSAVAQLNIPAQGLGFMAAPRIVPGHELWMEWWHRVPEGFASDRRHVLDPARYDFYDYTTVDAYAVPREERQRWADAPYFDYGGLDDYIATISVPIFAGEDFVGVAAFDVLISDLERHLAPWLMAVHEPLAVVNGQHRVVVSNNAMWNVGETLAPQANFKELELGEFGWGVAIGNDTGEREG